MCQIEVEQLESSVADSLGHSRLRLVLCATCSRRRLKSGAIYYAETTPRGVKVAETTFTRDFGRMADPFIVWTLSMKRSRYSWSLKAIAMIKKGFTS